MNTQFIAKQYSNDIWDTLFFSGKDFTREKTTLNGKKTYVFQTPEFTLTIEGNSIYIGGKKFSIYEAKRWIANS